MNWLLVFIPITVLFEIFSPEKHLLIFLFSALAIVPLAGLMGHATEELAERMGSGVGGLLNATFGNAAELIIAFAALRQGLYGVVKASLAGAIIGNILFVLGASMLAGGIRYREQKFNVVGVRSQATMLTLATIALIIPAAYSAIGPQVKTELGYVSVLISIVLLVVYLLNLMFTLVTHREFFQGENGVRKTGGSSLKPALMLAGATVLLAWMSEILVGAIDPAAKELGLGDAFVGVFVVAILATMAEQFTAIKAALKDKLDLTLSIALGSSVQITLFVAPVLVLLSYVLGPTPMDLAFSKGLVLSILLAVLILLPVAGDGRSDWLKGVQLLAVYIILGIVFYFIPSVNAQ